MQPKRWPSAWRRRQGTALVLFGLGALVSSRRLAGGLEAAKDGLFLVVALELFVLAGMLMLKGKKPEPP